MSSNSRSSTVRRLTLPALVLIASPLHGQQPWRFAPDSEVRTVLTQRVADHRSAGLVVGLLEPDGHTRFLAAGDPGPGRRPLDAQSVFEIGSITKVFTATLLAELVQEGKVRLDDPAQKYLPASVHLPTRNGKQITLGMLSEQNSGLPRMPSNFHPADSTNPYADYTVAQMYDFLSGVQLSRDPGAEFEYSNLGVGLLGHILTLATHTPYEQLLHDRITGPLGMTHTGIMLTPWMREHLALGHGADGVVVSNWDLPTLAGAGAIRSTAEDMLRFADANVHPERGPLHRAMVFAQTERAAAGGMRIGLNWFTMHGNSHTIVTHNGGTGGYRTFLGLEPSRKVAVVVLTNSTGQGADDVGLHLLDPMLPLAPKPQPPTAHTAIELPASTLARYVGTYELTPAFLLEATLRDSALYLQGTGQPALRLWPESETGFFLKEVDAQITFVRDAQGVTTSLVLHQNGGTPTAKKVK